MFEEEWGVLCWVDFATLLGPLTSLLINSSNKPGGFQPAKLYLRWAVNISIRRHLSHNQSLSIWLCLMASLISRGRVFLFFFFLKIPI